MDNSRLIDWRRRAVDGFATAGRCVNIQPYGEGHIHDTYRVWCSNAGKPVSYILQRLNTGIFKNPATIMDNIVRVTTHIRHKLAGASINDENNISRRVLTVIPTPDGQHLLQTPNGDYWRMYLYIDKTKTPGILQTDQEAFAVARLFGEFIARLADFPPPPLHITIPDFHNGPKRMADFRAVLAADTCNRAKLAEKEIAFILDRGSIFDVLPALVAKGEIPMRVTHNDTKVNNALLDEESGAGLCVIDLDTVMPGLLLYDFGDLVRSALGSTAEDERDIGKISLSLSRYQAILKGFLAGTGNILTAGEYDNLALSAAYMTLMVGVRFLSDYLAGDHYFKIHRPGQNLDRCRAQFKLAQVILENQEEMERLVESLLR